MPECFCDYLGHKIHVTNINLLIFFNKFFTKYTQFNFEQHQKACKQSYIDTDNVITENPFSLEAKKLVIFYSAKLCSFSVGSLVVFHFIYIYNQKPNGKL